MDLLFLSILFVFFIAMVALVAGCAHLSAAGRGPTEKQS